MLAVNLIFVIIGSIYTNIVTRIDAKAKAAVHSRIINGNANQSSNNIVNTSITVNVNVDAELNRNHRSKFMFKRFAIVDRFFSCFSLSKNSSIITTDYLGSDSIEVIHGMR